VTSSSQKNEEKAAKILQLLIDFLKKKQKN